MASALDHSIPANVIRADLGPYFAGHSTAFDVTGHSPQMRETQ